MASTTPSRGQVGILTAAFLLALAAISFVELRMSEAAATMDKTLQMILVRPFHPVSNFRLRDVYTGFPSVDLALRFLEGVFLPGAAGWDRAYQVHQAYFLLSFASVMAVWMVDAGRRRSAWKLTSFTSLWAILYSVVGGAVIAPLYYLAYLYESTRPAYFSHASRQVPLPYAKAILPAILLGYIIPTLAWYYPFPNDPTLQTKQLAISCWHFSPLFANALLYFFRSFVFAGAAPAISPRAHEARASAAIRRTYLLLAVFCAAVHWYAVAACLSERSDDPTMHVWPLFLRRLPGGFRDDWTWRPFGVKDLGFDESVHWIFQVDAHAVFVTALLGGVLMLWDVQRAGGYGTGPGSKSMWSIVPASVCASLIFGPATVTLALAWIRETWMTASQKSRAAKN